MIVKVATTNAFKFLTDAKNFLIEEAAKGNAYGMGDIPDYMWDYVYSKVTDIGPNHRFAGMYDITGTVAESDAVKKEMKPEKENSQYLWMTPTFFYVKDDVTGTDGLSFIETERDANAFINEMQVLVGLNMVDDTVKYVPVQVTDLAASLFYVARADRCLGVTAV